MQLTEHATAAPPAEDAAPPLDDSAQRPGTCRDAHSTPQPLVLRLRGGKGGFGSNLRAAGKQKLTDNFDACRDLQGRRIRHKTAAQKLQEWQAEAQVREREKAELKQAREAAKAEERSKITEVDMRSVRVEKAAALARVADAVRFAVRNGHPAVVAADEAAAGLDGGEKASPPALKRRRVDALLLGDEDGWSDEESEEESEEEREHPQVRQPEAEQRHQAVQGGVHRVAASEEQQQDVAAAG